MNETHQLSLPLTPMQTGMLLVSMDSKLPDYYLQQLVGELREELDVERLKTSWDNLINRHPVLRTQFREGKDGIWIQDICTETRGTFNLIDWRTRTCEDCLSNFEVHLEQDRLTGFDFHQETPHRLTVVLYPEQQARVLWTCHHCLMDGRSMSYLMKELWEYYEGKDFSPTKVEDYASFINHLSERESPQSIPFWQNALKGHDEHDFTAFKSRAPSKKAIHWTSLQMDTSFSEKLETLTRGSSFTVNTISQAAWFLLLSCYTETSDLVIGIVRSCRFSMPQSCDGVAGLGINTLPLRTQLNPQQSIRNWLEDLRSSWLDARPHELNSLSQIRGWTHSAESHFKTLHVHDRQSIDQAINEIATSDRSFRLINGRNECALSISTTETPVFEAEIQGDPTVFDADSLADLAQNYKHLLEQIVERTDDSLQSIYWLDASQKKRLIYQFNTENKLPEHEATVIAAFRQQCLLRPQQMALHTDQGSFSYKELFESAEAVANELKSNCPHGPIGILLKDKAATVVAIFGVLLANRCFVTLDPNYPDDRLTHMVKDSQTRTLITQTRHGRQANKILNSSKGNSRTIVLGTNIPYTIESVESDSSTELGEEEDSQTTKDWVYILYTSGTTGKPKGVPISNKNLMPLMAWQEKHFKLGPETRTISTLSFTFDFGIQEIFTTLMFGGTLYIPPIPILRKPELFIDHLSSHQISMIYAVPSFMEMILTAGIPMPTLRVILLGGERLYWSLADRLSEQLDNACIVFNGYGPTEATINNAMHLIDREAPRLSDSVPIGRPSGYSKLFLLDPDRRPVPINVPGELYIGGPGLSEGYINRSSLKSERFVELELDDGKVERLYRTGDRVKFLADDTLEFLGRIDNQIKLFGYRIELEEIEAQLDKHPQVKSIAVKLENTEDGLPILAAYFQTNQATIEVAQFRKFARQHLPSQMIPSRFCQIEEMPLTRNGKIDRKKLNEPPRTPEPTSKPSTRNPYEKWFYHTDWKEVSYLPQPRSKETELQKNSYLIIGDTEKEHHLQLGGQIYPFTKSTRTDLDSQLQGLTDQNTLPDVLIFFTSKAESTDSTASSPFFELLSILQTIGKYYRTRALRLAIITQNAQAVSESDLTYPEAALLLGLCKAIPFEMPEISWMSIDLESQTPNLSSTIILNLISSAENGDQYAIRKDKILQWNPQSLRQTEQASSHIKEGGTYLITGGLGAIGLVLANGIAKKHKVNFALLDIESAVTGFDRNRLKDLEASGCQVELIGTDICDASQLGKSLEVARRRFGKIDGVIHTAGRVSPSIIQKLTQEDAEQVLAPKVQGTQFLAKALLLDAPDFVILCSSIDAIRGSFNQASYCAANAFLDAFALHMRQQGQPYISINWDVWSDTGMAARTQVAEELQEARQEELALGISSREGVQILFDALALNLPQLIVSTTSLSDRIGQLGWTLQNAKELSQETPSLKATHANNKLQDTVYEIFKTILDDEDLSIEDNFFQSGGNSISAMRIVSRLKNELGRNISISSIFEAPTVSKMVQWLEES